MEKWKFSGHFYNMPFSNFTMPVLYSLNVSIPFFFFSFYNLHYSVHTGQYAEPVSPSNKGRTMRTAIGPRSQTGQKHPRWKLRHRWNKHLKSLHSSLLFAPGFKVNADLIHLSISLFYNLSERLERSADVCWLGPVIWGRVELPFPFLTLSQKSPQGFQGCFH